MVVRVGSNAGVERCGFGRVSRFFRRYDFGGDALKVLLHRGDRLATFEMLLRFVDSVVAHGDVGEHDACGVKARV